MSSCIIIIFIDLHRISYNFNMSMHVINHCKEHINEIDVFTCKVKGEVSWKSLLIRRWKREKRGRTRDFMSFALRNLQVVLAGFNQGNELKGKIKNFAYWDILKTLVWFIRLFWTLITFFFLLLFSVSSPERLNKWVNLYHQAPPFIPILTT